MFLALLRDSVRARIAAGMAPAEPASETHPIAKDNTAAPARHCSTITTSARQASDTNPMRQRWFRRWNPAPVRRFARIPRWRAGLVAGKSVGSSSDFSPSQIPPVSSCDHLTARSALRYNPIFPEDAVAVDSLVADGWLGNGRPCSDHGRCLIKIPGI